MVGETYLLGHLPKKPPNPLATLSATKESTVPNAIMGEQGGDSLRVVLLVAKSALAMFKLLDLFDVEQPLDFF